GEMYVENFGRRFVRDGTHRRSGRCTAARWRRQQRRQRRDAGPQAGSGGQNGPEVEADGRQADAPAPRHASPHAASSLVGLASPLASPLGVARQLGLALAPRLAVAPLPSPSLNTPPREGQEELTKAVPGRRTNHDCWEQEAGPNKAGLALFQAWESVRLHKVSAKKSRISR